MTPSHRRCVLPVSFLALWFSPACAPSRQAASLPADLVLRHAAVYTAAQAQPWAEAVAVRDGRIVYVGTTSGVAPWIAPGTDVVDLRGRMLLPGFHDVHVHPVSGGIELGECNLNDDSTSSQIVATIRRYATEHPDLPWVRGGGWQLPIFPEANPSKSLLDSLVADRPVYLVAADGHSAWVNSRALATAGITRSTADPPNGRIERDEATGEPTGTLRESAMDLVARHLPAYSLRDYVDGLKRGLAMANRFGITSLYEASASDSILAAYAELERRGALTSRVVAAMYVDPAKDTAQLERLGTVRREHAGGLFRADAAKIFVDGVIEARTAALLAPYVDRPGYRGVPNLEPEALDRLVTVLDRERFQVHVHAIGDRAIRMALDAFERARATNGARDRRHLIAHLELIDPQDIPRFRALGVIAAFQPLWAQADEYITELTEPRLGPARSRWLYPIQSVAQTGAVVACGSDWSVSSMNPLEAIQVAITRRAPGAGEAATWIPEERADLATMLAAYTINGAYAMRQEGKTGSIEVGKSADLVVLDRNLFHTPVHEIHRARVLLTLFRGREVYQDSVFATR